MFGAIVVAATLATHLAAELPIVPRPVSVSLRNGAFDLGPRTRLVFQTGNKGAEDAARFFADAVRPATGYRLQVTPGGEQPGAVFWTTKDADPKLGPEGYELVSRSDGIVVRAPGAAGLFYGTQTLRQMLPSAVFSSEKVEAKWSVPAARVWDKPRFVWRGYLLDVCRHFRSVDYVKRAIDSLAAMKMNVFHWHLTEDQGWRIQINRYPKLTEIGAWRNQNGERYGGFYTQKEIRDVVAYAAKRQVTVVPEIEMPGHSVAALASYPELSCTGGPFQVETRWGVFEDIYCAGKDETFVFLKNVLDEVLRLFPSKFIHIGGDEAPKVRWDNCPDCKKRMADLGLKDSHELQSWFVRQFDQYLAQKGRRLIGWDEILEGGLAEGAAVQSWRGMGGAVAAASQGHDVVASPTSHCYLDYSYGTISLAKAYSFEPVPSELAPDQRQRILGVSGNMWAERTPTEVDINRQTYPRLVALAEVGWTPAERKDFSSFEPRLAVHSDRLNLMGLSGAYGTPVGNWSPRRVSEEWSTLEWDVTSVVKEPGDYRFEFIYEDGAHGLDVSFVELAIDGKVVAEDRHVGFSGAQARETVYRLNVPALGSGVRVVLRASVKGSGGTDSRGRVVLVPKSRR